MALSAIARDEFVNFFHIGDFYGPDSTGIFQRYKPFNPFLKKIGSSLSRYFFPGNLSLPSEMQKSQIENLTSHRDRSDRNVKTD